MNNGFDFLENNVQLTKKSIDKDKTKKEKINKLPWIEKYRPKKINDIVSQDKIIKSLQISLETNNLPHLLFFGPPGTGKTSTILAIGRELFGQELMKERVIELNASDDRGINAVREKIKIYAMNSLNNPSKYKKDNLNKYPCPPYKIIVLDEADSMTKDAQSALRKIMEDYSNITRFCFICNYISKIIEPITSRCAVYGFIPLNKKLMFNKLDYIANEEKIKHNNKTIDKIVDLSDGDMRKAIMMLQNLKYIQHKYSINETVDKIIELNGYIPENLMNNILNSLKTKDFDSNINLIREFINDGYPVDYFLEQFFEYIVKDNTLSDEMKSKICFHFSNNQKNIIDGSDEYLQMLDIVMYSYMIINNKL